jgi:hypothetical protein
MTTMAQVDIMQILSKFAYGVDGNVGDISALCQNQIPESWGHLDYFLYCMICKPTAACKVQYPKMFVSHVRRKAGKSRIRN